MSIKINEDEIKEVINNFNFFEPYFEDEIPNTYPVPNYNNWDRVDEDNYEKILSDINQNGDNNISSLYISIPYCNYRCTYCVYNIHVGKNEKKEYLNVLCKEMALYKEKLKVKYDYLKRIYIGGGTPSILTIEQLEQLFNILKVQEINFNNLESFTFELSPETVNEEKLDFLIDNGVNRFSIGIQDIHKNILKIVKRNTNKDQIRNTLTLLNRNVTYYNVDVIYGLPEQKVKEWTETLNTLIEYNVPEFTLYNLRIGRKSNIRNLNLSLYDEKIFLKIATGILSNNNYKQVRPFHWVRDERIKELWEKYKYAPFSDQHAKKGPGMELGIGASAVSHIKDIIFKNYDIDNRSDENTLYYFKMINHEKLPIEAAYRLNDYDKVIRHLLYGVENGYIDNEKLNKKQKIIARQFTDLKNKFIKHNLIREKDNKLYLTDLGKLFYNNIEKEIIFKLKTFDEKYKLSTILDLDKINDVCETILDYSNNYNLKVLELGSGIGSISIPIILDILKDGMKNVNIKWEAIELDDKKIEYYKQKLINSTDSITKIEYNYKNDNKIIINNKNKNIEITFKNIDIERKVVNEELTSELEFNKYDIVFMPSFLNHIIFWKQVLFAAFDILRVDGLLVLGYPNGAWSIPEYGPTSFYDVGNQKEWIAFWQQFYKKYPNFYLFFRLPFNEMSSTLEENVLEFLKVKEIRLIKPSFEILQFFSNKRYFSFCNNIYPEDSYTEKFIKLEEIIGNSSVDLDKIDDFRFTFELIKKKADIKNIQNQFSYNLSLTSKNIDPKIYSMNVKDINKLLIYGIVRTILGESIIKRKSSNSKDNKNSYHIIGSYVENRLDKVLENQFIPDVIFFSEPNPADIKQLHNYMCFYSAEKTIPITRILTDFLPKKYPLKNYLIFKYKVDDEIKIKTCADENDGILYIEIQITKEFLNENVLIDQDKVENKPQNLYEKGNEIIAFPYNKKIGIKDDNLNKYLIGNIDDEDKLNIVDFFLEDPKLGEEYNGKKKYEIRKGIIKRLLILAHTFLKADIYSSIGIPLKGFLGNESRLISVIWLVYNAHWDEIKSEELVYIKKFQNNILVPIISKLNLILLGLAKQKLDAEQLKTAIISILVDSYAHNISAHSLSALEWWFSNRSKFLGRRIFVGDGELNLSKLLPSEISVSAKEREKTTEKYYEALDLTDSTYDARHYSLFDYLQFSKEDKNLFIFSEKVNESKTTGDFNPRFPVSIDYAIAPFVRFLKDKGAFWSGVTRDMAFGGESKTLYEVLWEDFANNPLYLGTIAASEKIYKLNIYLKLGYDVEDGKGEKKNNFISGRFVSIDLSVIDYENQLANPKKNTKKGNNINENEIEVNHDQKVNNNCERENNKTNVNFIEFDQYSQYGFVRLGECFSYFREELSKDEYKIFLPGGVIGEHALFTIIENTIRNIKHYKDNNFKEIQKNGIDLYISIQDENKDGEDDKSTRLKIGVWLNHITSLKAKVKDSNDETVDKKIIEIMEEKAVGSIIDDMGMPRMGGNSQDKACAAMLFNNNFMSVEVQDTKLQKDYYPWIKFEEDSEDGEQGVLKKYFTVWKSDEFFTFEGNDINDLREKFEKENIARFKFFVSENKVTNEMKALLRENGIIRILENTDMNNKSIGDIYKEWLEKWCNVKFDNNQQFVIFRSGDKGKGTGGIKAAIWMKDNVLVCNYQDIFPFNNVNENNLEISHGKEQDYHCNVRSHGKFIQKFFRKDIDQFSTIKMNVNENGDIIDDSEEKVKKEALLLEFIETVKTKIVIFDDRVNGRFSVYNQGKRKMFEEQLFLEVYPEEYSKFKKYKNNVNDGINILIMHLSFIENLKDSSGRKYSEERIVDFIRYELAPDDSNLPENFIFVITSGRGRDAWNSAIKNSPFSKNTLFKPIESILNAVNAGISYNDHFDVKYNLVKAIFGS